MAVRVGKAHKFGDCLVPCSSAKSELDFIARQHPGKNLLCISPCHKAFANKASTSSQAKRALQEAKEERQAKQLKFKLVCKAWLQGVGHGISKGQLCKMNLPEGHDLGSGLHLRFRGIQILALTQVKLGTSGFKELGSLKQLQQGMSLLTNLKSLVLKEVWGVTVPYDTLAALSSLTSLSIDTSQSQRPCSCCRQS
ncbi:TPA: hypothetical protein ACH3X1_002314 [Trebouxia sp. C0004]